MVWPIDYRPLRWRAICSLVGKTWNSKLDRLIQCFVSNQRHAKQPFLRYLSLALPHRAASEFIGPSRRSFCNLSLIVFRSSYWCSSAPRRGTTASRRDCWALGLLQLKKLCLLLSSWNGLVSRPKPQVHGLELSSVKTSIGLGEAKDRTPLDRTKDWCFKGLGYVLVLKVHFRSFE